MMAMAEKDAKETEGVIARWNEDGELDERRGRSNGNVSGRLGRSSVRVGQESLAMMGR
jgi:hypothetical protein